MHVAVVGAGMSGISCATTLANAGASVVVFDRGHAPAGRMATWQAHLPFDYGASYITTRDPAFGAVVARLMDEGRVAEWTARIVAIDAINRVPRPATEVARFVGVPGMSAIPEALGSPLDVQTNVTVESIERTGSSWRLEADGRSLNGFDAVVLAMPPAQALPLIGTHPLARIVEGAEMAPCWSVMASWAESLDVPFDAAFVNDGPLSWVARDGSKPGRPHPHTWVLHGSPDWSIDHFDVATERVIPLLLRAFEAIARRPLPAVSFAAAHRWRYASVVRTLEQSHLWDADTQLGIAGDWCAGPRVEGAWLSGHALGHAILDA